MLLALVAWTLRFCASIEWVAGWQYELDEEGIEMAIECSKTTSFRVAPSCRQNGFIISTWLHHPFVTYLHLFAASATALAQTVQFGRTKKGDTIHSVVGWFAVATIVIASVGAGAILFYSKGGLGSIAALTSLMILWVFFVVQGIILIKRGDRQGHRRAMTRVFALTFSAVTLRLYYALLLFFGVDEAIAFIWAEWLGLVGNVIVVEVYLRGCMKADAPLLSSDSVSHAMRPPSTSQTLHPSQVNAPFLRLEPI